MNDVISGHQAVISQLRIELAAVSARLAQVMTEYERDRQLVFAIATESADELVKICGVNPSDDSARLNYLAELFAPEPTRRTP